MKKKVVVFWFRRDLRLYDNAGLLQALQIGYPVLPVFIFDRNILDILENKRDPRLSFIHTSLCNLNDSLKSFNSGILTVYDKPIKAWKKILTDYQVVSVYANEDYEPYARERDKEVAEFLQGNAISFKTTKDQVIFNPLEVLKDDGKPYTVFTPYKNKWRSKMNDKAVLPHKSENYMGNFYPVSEMKIISLKQMGFQETETGFPQAKVDHRILTRYASSRDFPALKGTSGLSIHLRFGTVSIRRLVAEALPLSETWINELIWREFYMMILYHFPHVSGYAFKQKYDRIKWRNNEAEFRKWTSGQTGYPIVDAGMRELNATGFMHNRLRMITAGFLTKHLLIDWRWGEAYFASRLLDFEMASNNGGWQWAAGTGCDAAPYFRIFNPYEQTKKFDPQFRYIRCWVPEFEDFSYPKPMVDHSVARERCLMAYRSVLSG